MTVFSVENFLREQFFRDHGHLISPWNYGAAAAKACNETLLRRGWLQCDARRIVYVKPKLSMAEASSAFPPWALPVDKPPA